MEIGLSGYFLMTSVRFLMELGFRDMKEGE